MDDQCTETTSQPLSNGSNHIANRTVSSTPFGIDQAAELTSPFDKVTLVPADNIIQVLEEYQEDQSPRKINLGVGAYRDEKGDSWILPCVEKAKDLLAQDKQLNYDYGPVIGLSQFLSESAKLVFGKDNELVKASRIASLQSLGGTGACAMGAAFLSKFFSPWIGKTSMKKVVHVSNPTWAAHKPILTNAGLTISEYPYFDKESGGLDFDGFMEALRQAPAESVILLHACAHNPTGVDPTRKQWEELARIFIEKRHFAFFDCAYQGFASGDLDHDAWAIRHFASLSIPLLVCQSYSKNSGLYSERIGCLHVVCSSSEETEKIKSQLARLQRSTVSMAPTYAARLITLILTRPNLFDQFQTDIKTMSHRILATRQKFYTLLTKLSTPPPSQSLDSWSHLTTQIGMFTYSGLNKTQIKILKERAHIYMTDDGRLSIAGLNDANLPYVTESLDRVMRGDLL